MLIKATNLNSYQNQALVERALVAMTADQSGVSSASNIVAYWDINGSPTLIFTPSSGATRVRMVDSRDFAYFVDGEAADLLKWNISEGLSSWGIAAPAVGVVLGAATSGGNITVTIGRKYYVAFFNSTTQSYSDLSPASALTGPLTAENQPLTNIPVSTNAQVDSKIILATADGGDPTTLYELGTIPNATTTFTDSTSELNLLASDVWQDTDSNGLLHGLFGNIPPPNGSFPIAHNGRIFMAIGEVLYFSKNLDEVTTSSGIIAGRYEEAWPPVNAINVSVQAEEIHGILSDGQTLYIGTEEHIFRLLGDSPSNFSEPEIIFPQTGLLTQDVWQLVYLQGTPVGTMWITPDYRIMKSDFNTYQDVGTPIQTTLNTININAIAAAWAVMVSNGPYNFYMLAIPTGTNTIPDTFCVYDMSLQKWYIWQFADLFLSGIFYFNLAGVPHIIFCDSNGIIRQIDPASVMDRATDTIPVPIVSELQTSWLDMGDDRARKTLNEVEVGTVDTNMLVTVQGATTQDEFANPTITLVSNQTPTTNFMGDLKVFLAGTQAIDRTYKFRFLSTSSQQSLTSDVILGDYSVEVLPMNRI